MIVTVTPNPSIDATLTVAEALTRGAVHRALSVTQAAGGKGINVSRAAHLADADTVAVFPASPADPFLSLVRDTRIHTAAVEMTDPIRVNTTITEPDGTTTKVNGPGPTLDSNAQAALIEAVTRHSQGAGWVVFAGSLPQGVPANWYAELVRQVRASAPGARIAVDTSDEPLRALGEELGQGAPDVVKPNGLELGQLTGTDGLALERAAENGDFSGVVTAARTVVERGIAEVLVTLGGAGAVLVTADGAWAATPAPVAVRSTVGAGDSSLAGYILARRAGEDFPAALARSVAYGTAAAGLPGTEIPSPAALNIEGTTVFAL